MWKMEKFTKKTMESFKFKIIISTDIVLTDNNMSTLEDISETFERIDYFDTQSLYSCPIDSDSVRKFKLGRGDYEIKFTKGKSLKLCKDRSYIDCVIEFQLSVDYGSFMIITSEVINNAYELILENWISERGTRDVDLLIDDFGDVLLFWMKIGDGLYNCIGKFNEEGELVSLEIDFLNISPI